MIAIAILIQMAYNKSVIATPNNSNKSVRERFCGTIDFEQAAGVEEIPLPQATDFKRRAAGGQDLDSEGIRQTLL